MGFLKDLHKGAWAHHKDIFEKAKDDPERLFLGAMTPLGTELWGGVTGQDWESAVNMFGGPTEQQFQDMEAEGINTGPFRDVDTVMQAILSFYAGGAAAGGLGAAAGGGSSGAAAGSAVPGGFMSQVATGGVQGAGGAAAGAGAGGAAAGAGAGAGSSIPGGFMGQVETGGVQSGGGNPFSRLLQNMDFGGGGQQNDGSQPPPLPPLPGQSGQRIITPPELTTGSSSTAPIAGGAPRVQDLGQSLREALQRMQQQEGERRNRSRQQQASQVLQQAFRRGG